MPSEASFDILHQRDRADGGGLQVVARLERRLILGVITVTLLLLVLTTGVITHVALGAFEREVRPGLGREATAIATSMAAQIERAVLLGVPADRLMGVEPFFEATLANHLMIDNISWVTPGGTHTVIRSGSAHASQDVVLAVQNAAGPIGTLRLNINPSRLERSANDTKWDIAIVLLVALLTTVEVLVFLTDRYVSTPLRLAQRLAGHVAVGNWTRREQPTGLDAAGRFLAQLNALVRRMNERRRHVGWLAVEVIREVPQTRASVQAVLARLSSNVFTDGYLQTEANPRSPTVARGALFLYLFAEQLSTSFIPIFARTVQHPGGWVPEAFAIGLPITAFAAMIAVSSPFAASLVGRIGARGVLTLGCLPAMLGYAMTAQADSIAAFTLWRSVTAIGYALITIACQAYLVAASDDARDALGQPVTTGRARNMAVFVYAAMTGAVCGTAIGAVLADRIGYRGTFMVSAVLTALAGILAYRTMDRLSGRRKTVSPVAGTHAGALGLALRSPKFVALLLFAAVPAKIVLTGFVFYISPLFLQSMENTQPEIGRQVMLYALTMLLTIRVGAWLADRLGAATSCIALAAAATGLGLLLAFAAPAALAVPFAIIVTGLAQGLASAPMLAVVSEVCPGLAQRLGLPTLYGYLRFGERLGSIAGPILAASLVALAGFATAIGVIGMLSLVSACAYWATTSLARRSPVEESSDR